LAAGSVRFARLRPRRIILAKDNGADLPRDAVPINFDVRHERNIKTSLCFSAAWRAIPVLRCGVLQPKGTSKVGAFI